MRKINKLVLSFITLLLVITALVGCTGTKKPEKPTNTFDPNTKGAQYAETDKLNTDFSKSAEMTKKDYKWKEEEKAFGENYRYFMRNTTKIGVEKNEKNEDVAYTIDKYQEGKNVVEKKLTYPVRPKRVVSLFESHLNLAWEMGLRNIVGRNATSVKGVLHKEIEENKAIQVIGEGAVLASTEKLLALNPDLVIIDAMHTSQETKKKLVDAKIPFVELISSSVNWYLRSAKLMAAIAGRADLFEQVAKEMTEDITKIKSAVAQYTNEKGLTKVFDNTNPKKPVLKEDNRLKMALTLLEAGSTNKNLLGYNDWGANGKIIKTLNGRNLYEGKSNPNAQNPMFASRIPINNDELIKFNPTKIFVQLHGEMTETEMQKYIEENILNNPVYQSIDAVKNKQVFALPAKLFLYRPNKEYAKVYKYFAEKLFDGIKLPQLNCDK